MELVSLRQQQETNKSYIKAMEQRIEGAEKKQRKMMSFLARAMQSPSFLHQLLKQRDMRVKELEDEAAERGRGSSVSELEALALEMQGYGKQKNVKEEEDMVVERELDDGFWEELLSNEKAERWEFANEGFLLGQRHLLKSIKRRASFASSIQDPCVQLLKEKQLLSMELASLRQQQQTARIYIKSMEQRIEGAEKKQRMMMSFLARALQGPTFLYQLLQERDMRFKEVEVEERERGSSVSELEALALEMQGYGRQRNVKEEEDMVVERELDDGFWEELLSNESLASTSIL
ncbi:hypothetical protein HID58_077635 [Brassica napus]|uniref:Uncharacterized protein n=1 Tax=Brassica napus TaxID=3708 RepID=A0ABQ7YT95_BRANA|nr:hypothetical protein HID58_077635 [Brassica napus]